MLVDTCFQLMRYSINLKLIFPNAKTLHSQFARVTSANSCIFHLVRSIRLVQPIRLCFVGGIDNVCLIHMRSRLDSSSIMCYRTEIKKNTDNPSWNRTKSKRKQRMSCTLLMVYWTRLSVFPGAFVSEISNGVLCKALQCMNTTYHRVYATASTAWRRMDNMMVQKVTASHTFAAE